MKVGQKADKFMYLFQYYLTEHRINTENILYMKMLQINFTDQYKILDLTPFYKFIIFLNIVPALLLTIPHVLTRQCQKND